MPESTDDIRASLEKQISDLKKEISRMSKSLAAQASDAMDDANDALEEGKGRARQAISHVRDQAHLTAGAMRENPGTTATVLGSVGLIGMVAGIALAGAFFGDRRR